jgi:DNA segregation ATPase FtsK/SpoIIIE, S-DNA-T family
MAKLLLSVRDTRSDRDVAVEFDDGVTIAQVVDELANTLGQDQPAPLTLERVTRGRATFNPARRLSRVELRSGDVVRLAAARPGELDAGVPADGSVGVIRILSGPETGRIIELERGELTVGRADTCDVVLRDDMASRRHAKVLVSDIIEVADLGSTNGVLVNEEQITGARRLRNGDRIMIGDTHLDIHHRDATPGALRSGGNAVEFNRPPRVREPVVATKLELPTPPEAPGRQRLPMIAAFVVPLLMGAFYYALTRSVASIAFVAVSPVMMLGSYWESKRNGRADLKERLAIHAEDVRSVCDLADAACRTEERLRHSVAPPVSSMLDAVRSLSPLLWEREPDDDDFLAVRVGLADQPSQVSMTLPHGGARDLRAALAELPARYATIPSIPVQVDLRAGHVGVAGMRSQSFGVARALVAQLAVLHSPAELAIAALAGEDGVRDWEWLKWLPHTRSAQSPLRATQLASGVDAAMVLLEDLQRILSERMGSDRFVSAAPSVPHLVVVVDDSLPLRRERLAELLQFGPRTGITFLWVSETVRLLPKACSATIELAGSATSAAVRFVEEQRSIEPTETEALDEHTALELARALAPIVDMTSARAGGGDLPSTAPLVDLLGGPAVLDDETLVLDRWQESASSNGLRGPVGAAATGAFTIDLRSDGPHGLVAGTTGAGKSEFLQSMLAGLAATHSPSRVTFLLIDYKGGAAFKDVVALPHTVGLVTDLTPALVRRALTSLRAELHRRERMLADTGTKDLVDLEERFPGEAPPSLLIVVDEFAALAREVPDFVEGVVDVAQRGRSLGLHLVLATQRPAGVITENIRANTNLRVALRVASEDDSQDVIASRAAAQIDRARPGRGLARLGPSELISFQSAYVGGHTVASDETAHLDLADFLFGSERRWPARRIPQLQSVDRGPTDLQRLATRIGAAFAQTGKTAPRRPWLPPLSDHYDLKRLPRPQDDRRIPYGVVDDPARQVQHLASIEFDRDGGVLVYGTGGSGKTVLLRTIAASAALAPATTPVHLYGLDFAGRGLELLEPLPRVGAVVNGDDYERFTRLVRDLRTEVAERAKLFARFRAASLPECRAAAGDAIPRLVILLDGYEAFQASYERIDRGEWIDTINRLVAEGRQVGVHFVLTGTRRSSFPSALTANVGRRLVLPLASLDEYSAIGIDAKLVDGNEPPGRAVDGENMVQVAVLGGDLDTRVQATTLAQLGRALERAGVQRARPVRVLPDRISRDDLHPALAGTRNLVVGYTEAFDPFEFEQGEHYLVVGPVRSGRTTAIATAAHAAVCLGLRPLVGAARRAVPNLPPGVECIVGPDEVSDALMKLDASTAPVVLLDDLEDLLERGVDGPLSDLLSVDGPTVVAACEVANARRNYSISVGQLRKSRQIVLLQPDPDFDGDLAGSPLPRTRRAFPPGRGIFAARNSLTPVQFAS